MSPRLWSAALVAVAGAGMSLVALAGAAGVAAAAGDAGPVATPPNGSISGLPPDAFGATPITVTWTPSHPLDVIQNETLTVSWTRPANAPSGVALPAGTDVTVKAAAPSCNVLQKPVTCAFQWPSGLLTSGYVLNSTYSVTYAAQECVVLIGNCASNPQTVSVQVANPPVAPSNVVATPTHNGSEVALTWDPNPEPDLIAYEVFRGATSVGRVSVTPANAGTSFTDVPTKDGSYEYSVKAYRFGPTYDTSVVSDASTVTPAVAVSGTATNPTTTTTVAGHGTIPPPFNPKPAPGSGFTPHGGIVLKPAPTGTVALAPNTPTTVDAGFQPVLPYAQPQPTDTPTTDPAVISAPPIAHKSGGRSVATMAAIGAGLLIAVIALHGLWLRSEVRRSGTLEALDPDR